MFNYKRIKAFRKSVKSKGNFFVFPFSKTYLVEGKKLIEFQRKKTLFIRAISSFYSLTRKLAPKKWISEAFCLFEKAYYSSITLKRKAEKSIFHSFGTKLSFRKQLFLRRASIFMAKQTDNRSLVRLMERKHR